MVFLFITTEGLGLEDEPIPYTSRIHYLFSLCTSHNAGNLKYNLIHCPLRTWSSELWNHVVLKLHMFWRYMLPLSYG